MYGGKPEERNEIYRILAILMKLRHEAPGSRPTSGFTHQRACQFLLKSQVDRLSHDDFNFIAKAGRQCLGVFQNQPSDGFPKQPIERQINPLHHPVHHLLLEALKIYDRRRRPVRPGG